MAVPGVLVHRVKGHATRLHGSRPGAHDVPWDIKSVSLDTFFPPWTVKCQIWMDALKPCHSGVSTDVWLFSDIHLSLAHHYRVFKRGLPHLAFRKDYLACLNCLRVFVSKAMALAQCDMTSTVSTHHPRSSEVESESPRKTRCARRLMRPTRVRDEPVGVEFPTLTVQDMPDLVGAIVYDCRPPLLPVSLRLMDIVLQNVYRYMYNKSLKNLAQGHGFISHLWEPCRHSYQSTIASIPPGCFG